MFAIYESTEKKGSIYYLIIRSFAGLAGMVLLLAAAFYSLAAYLIPSSFPAADIEKLLSETNALRSEAYAKIDADKLLGPEGYFEILDADANVIYSSNKKKKKRKMNMRRTFSNTFRR